MNKSLLKNIILEVLEESDYGIKTQGVNPKDLLIIKLDYDNLIVSVTAQQTFEVKGPNDSTIKELKEFINDNIKPKVRKEALKIFEKGVEDWNKWRKTHGQLFIDFSGLKVTNENLSGINFQSIDLSYSEFENVKFEGANLHRCKMHESKFIKCNLKRANLSYIEANLADFSNSNLSYSVLDSATLGGAILEYVDLQGVKLSEVNLKYSKLTNADLRGTNLSGALINLETKFDKANGIEKGINGVWNEETDSAALYSESPLGNSMKGPNIDAVLESLKRARKYFGFSFLISIGAMLIWYLKQDSTSIPFLKEFVLTKGQYLIIGMVSSIGLLTLSKSFLDDAFEGMKYLEDRKSAMSVGSFPWALTKFSGKKNDQYVISIISRYVLCLHPLMYLFLLDYSNLNYFLIVLFIILLSIGIWILIFSFNFQKPILFDRKTEEEKKREDIVSKLDEIVKIINLNTMFRNQ